MEVPSQGGVGQLSIPERRAFPRFPYRRKAMCQLQAAPCGDPWMMGNSEDISLTGFGFVLHRRFDPGSLLTIDLQRTTGDSWGTLKARVLYCTPQADGNWRLGCILVPAWSEEELQKWVNGRGTTP